MKILLRCSLAAFVAPHVGCFDPDGGANPSTEVETSAETMVTGETWSGTSLTTTSGPSPATTGEEMTPSESSSHGAVGSGNEGEESSTSEADGEELGSSTSALDGDVSSTGEGTTEENPAPIMCEEGTYRSSLDASGCTPWSSCGWAEVVTAGTSTNDVICSSTDVVRQFGTPENEFLFGLAVSDEATVYAAAEVGIETILRRYDSSGDLAWVRTVPNTDISTPRGVAVDQAGDVVVTGFTSGSTDGTPRDSDDYDSFACKYSSTGDLLWCRQFGATGWDEGRGVATDSSNNVIAVGTLDGEDVFVRVYGPDGALRWSQRFGPTEGTAGVNHVAIDSNDNIYIVGDLSGELDAPVLYGDGDLFIRKFSLGGDVLWTRRFGTGQHNSRVAISATNQVFATMLDLSEAVGQEGRYSFVLSLTPEGDLLWTVPLGMHGDEHPIALAMHSSGMLLVAGTSRHFLDDVFLSGLTSEGDLMFERTLGTTEREAPYALAASRSGPAFVGGWTGGSWGAMNAGEFDAFIVQLHPPVVSD